MSEPDELDEQDESEKSKRIYYTYSRDCIESHHSGERYGDWSAEYNCEVTGLYLKVPSPVYYDPIDLYGNTDCKKAWVVIVKYSDGDTFGSSSGNLCAYAAFSHKAEAEKCMKEILAEKSMRKFKAYQPWTGYFNSLESCEIEEFEIQ